MLRVDHPDLTRRLTKAQVEAADERAARRAAARWERNKELRKKYVCWCPDRGSTMPTRMPPLQVSKRSQVVAVPSACQVAVPQGPPPTPTHALLALEVGPVAVSRHEAVQMLGP